MKDSLFDLIGALTRSEKRYFKLFASRHTIGEENNYVTLFNFIEKQSNYDEQAIFQKFSGESFLNNFTITKKRLYHNILFAIESFHSGNSEEATWTRQLHSAEILISKNLFDQARKIINSVEKQAAKKENNLILQKVIRLKNTYQTEFSISSKLDNEQMGSNPIVHEKIYCQLMNSLFALRTKGQDNTIQENSVRESTAENQVLWQQIEILKAYRFQKISPMTTQLIESSFKIFKGNSELARKHFYIVLELHRLAMQISITTGDLITAKKHENEVQFITAESENHKGLKFSFQTLMALEFDLHTQKYHHLPELIQRTEAALETIRSIENKELWKEIQFKLLTAHLLSGSPSKALSYVNQLFQDNEAEMIDFQTSLIHILDCIIHCELKHTEYLVYAIKNSSRQLKNKGLYEGYHKLIFTALQKYSTANRKLEQEEILENLHNELATSKEIQTQQLFPIMEWLTQKIKSFGKIEIPVR